jgi:hypothetical protein
MSRLILAVAASTVLALAAVAVHQPAAFAATPASAPAATSTDASTPAPRGWLRGRGERLAALRNSPVFQTVRNLHELERLYLIDGRAQEIIPMYRDLLQRTENPAVRQFAYQRIARYELKPGDVGKSITTLRQSLDENLKRLPQQ